MSCIEICCSRKLKRVCPIVCGRLKQCSDGFGGTGISCLDFFFSWPEICPDREGRFSHRWFPKAGLWKTKEAVFALRHVTGCLFLERGIRESWAANSFLNIYIPLCHKRRYKIKDLSDLEQACFEHEVPCMVLERRGARDNGGNRRHIRRVGLEIRISTEFQKKHVSTSVGPIGL